MMIYHWCNFYHISVLHNDIAVKDKSRSKGGTRKASLFMIEEYDLFMVKIADSFLKRHFYIIPYQRFCNFLVINSHTNPHVCIVYICVKVISPIMAQS